MTSLLAATQEELNEVLESATRGREVARWLFSGRELPRELPEALPGITPAAWKALRDRFHLPAAFPAQEPVVSADGTTKWRTPLDGRAIETVLIPGLGRSTVCVSSQIGCTRGCVFCATRHLGFRRNLTPDEYLGQVYLAKGRAPPEAPLRNVVFMGMGEPLDNLDALLTTLRVLTRAPGPGFGPGHLTVSTSGVLPTMERFLAESPVPLALSLNATTDEVRQRLMPHTRLWPIGALLGALRREALRSPRRITFVEYVLIDGENDTDDDAHRLVALLEGLPARVNLIPHNPFEGSAFRPSTPARVSRFFDLVHRSGIRCLVRRPRGEEIAAACGQLALRVPGAPEPAGESA